MLAHHLHPSNLDARIAAASSVPGDPTQCRRSLRLITFIQNATDPQDIDLISLALFSFSFSGYSISVRSPCCPARPAVLSSSQSCSVCLLIFSTRAKWKNAAARKNAGKVEAKVLPAISSIYSWTDPPTRILNFSFCLAQCSLKRLNGN